MHKMLILRGLYNLTIKFKDW